MIARLSPMPDPLSPSSRFLEKAAALDTAKPPTPMPQVSIQGPRVCQRFRSPYIASALQIPMMHPSNQYHNKTSSSMSPRLQHVHRNLVTSP